MKHSHTAKSITTVTDLLKHHKLKITPTRVEVAHYLQRVKKPLTVAELKQALPKEDITTLYRAMLSFVEVGVVRTLQLQPGVVHYEWNLRQDHHHLICTRCGLIEELEDCIVHEWAGRYLKKAKHFTQITNHSFELFGLCKSCTRKST